MTEPWFHTARKLICHPTDTQRFFIGWAMAIGGALVVIALGSSIGRTVMWLVG